MQYPNSLTKLIQSSMWSVTIDFESSHELVQRAEQGQYDIWGMIRAIFQGMTGPFFAGRYPLPSLLPIFLLSTLFTSVWTILILLSTAVLKLLAPIHRFTAWFFDVEKHPVQAIGIISGALVMVGSLIWTVLRAMI